MTAPLTPSQSQVEALAALNARERLNLVGPAGTGKTTTLAMWIAEYVKEDEGDEPSCPRCKGPVARKISRTEANPNRPFVRCDPCNYFTFLDDANARPVVAVAPTHAAAEVLSASLPVNLQTKTRVTTLSSFLQHRGVINPVTAAMEFRPAGSWMTAEAYKKAAVKASVLARQGEEYVYVDNRCEFSSPLKDVKVVFVDECSMLSEEHVRECLELQDKHKFRLVFCGDSYQLPPVKKDMWFPVPDVESVELREQQRASGGGMDAVYLFFRDAVRSRGESFSWDSLPASPCVKFVKEVPASKSTPTVLAWRNTRVEAHNARLREATVGMENMSTRYCAGDRIVITRAVAGKDSTVAFQNGKRLVIETAIRSEFKYKSANIKDKGGNLVAHTWKTWEISAREDSEPRTFIFLDEEDSYTESTFKCLYRALKGKLQGVRKMSEKRPYVAELHALGIVSEYSMAPPIKHAYAMTVHKAQGSTFDRVVVDADDILMANEDERWRLMYVAATRAREEIIIVKN